jgi:hypothetical protein
LLNEREYDAIKCDREGDVESIENVISDSDATSFDFFFVCSLIDSNFLM